MDAEKDFEKMEKGLIFPDCWSVQGFDGVKSLFGLETNNRRRTSRIYRPA
jgi:hypothetical protein